MYYRVINYKIPFNKPWISGKEIEYIRYASDHGHLAGNGPFTRKCQDFFEERYNLKKCLLTTSCTDALEMASMLINIKPGDEVIVPSFTFVSTALAFARQGVVIRFADSGSDHPGMDEDLIEALINGRTRAIIPVHYAGVACDMDKIMTLSVKYDLFVIEDNANGIEGSYKGRPLGTIGHLGCFSFHETKNLHCGEGGMIAVNDSRFTDRAEIIWEKGTNRAQFYRGDATFYEWKDNGSSFLPSELNAAFLLAQAESIEMIQRRRLYLWSLYSEGFSEICHAGIIKLPEIPDYASVNASSFFLLCKDRSQRDGLILYLKGKDIMAVSHYLPLHRSEFYSPFHDGRQLKMSELYNDTLVRLPLYYDLGDEMVNEIISRSVEFLCKT